ncbi:MULTISPECIES: GntR family transcriptional regulator [Clostridium]|uniref:HTH-type transcriptional repressor YtrA n=4 Tax=Clostridium TaxID=1485 RepID=D8GLZ7_CLOLD|nr:MULTISPECIES: GntR family transcriptional regulator [Clostridium]ADK15571.1 predicted transcriptional regulator [Clostridium ljungdahlii DSM 13528]AGY74810.1 GntR family transcriptional regulator [Clostridium autoethanogenum DSM 10061]ALU34988.1 Transcriptional regulator GntR family [Clostridium autoethanogenum DSM 10061]OAA85423.1 HTH-type transcriptional repressor YtrA [Clostridium ljungdahlii DSM 13528]OAA93939.1 HTH-type transcriptional repressor YtrA [Clostridium coskatii]
MDVEFDSNVPIYMQIIDIVKRKIVKEELKPGDKLLSVREMSSKLKVNPNTIQRAYQELERNDIAYKQRGTGTFIKEDISMVEKLKEEMAQKIIYSFIIGMKELGFSSDEIIKIVEEKVQGGK